MSKYSITVKMQSDYETLVSELINETIYLSELLGPTYTKQTFETLQEMGIAIKVIEEETE